MCFFDVVIRWSICVFWLQLSPDDSVISKHHERALSAAFEFQKRTFVVSTKDKDEKDIPEDENIDHLVSYVDCFVYSGYLRVSCTLGCTLLELS